MSRYVGRWWRGIEIVGALVLVAALAAPAMAAPPNPVGEALSRLGQQAQQVAEQGVLRANDSLQVIAEGLDNPRGLGFDSGGALYVAEAGTGGSDPCFSGPEGTVCYGESGAVTKIFAGAQTRIFTGLPSLADPAGFAATGPHDVLARSDGSVEAVFGLGGTPDVRALLPGRAVFLGQLNRVSPNANVLRAIVDLAAFEATADPDGGEPDSNPYALAVNGGKRVVADAGGNSLVEVRTNGTMRTLAVFPARIVDSPFGPIPMQAVPTTVTRGPDGAYYVGQLTGFPFPVGGANVYRVPVGGGTPQVYRSGFTNIIDIAFGPDGSLYVLEIAANGLLSDDLTGALIRVYPDDSRETVASDGLVAPGGVAVGPDGALYVTNFSIFPGAGQVVRIEP